MALTRQSISPSKSGVLSLDEGFHYDAGMRVRNSRELHAHTFILRPRACTHQSVDMTGARLLLNDYIRSEKHPEDESLSGG